MGVVVLLSMENSPFDRTNNVIPNRVMDDQRELEINGAVMENDQQLWVEFMAQYSLIQNNLHHVHLSCSSVLCS